MKKKIDRLPAKVSQLGVRISMERNGARLISPSHIKFSGLMPASMLGGKAGKGRGRSCWRWRRKRSRASDGTTCATPPPPPPDCPVWRMSDTLQRCTGARGDSATALGPRRRLLAHARRRQKRVQKGYVFVAEFTPRILVYRKILDGESILCGSGTVNTIPTAKKCGAGSA
jgi:hypothetical protein